MSRASEEACQGPRERPGETYGGEAHSGEPARPLGRSILRGARLKCPACGEGTIFTGYLKTADHCPACGEEIGHHRADDLPAYLVIFLVGHIIVAGYMAVDTWLTWSMAAHMIVWSTATLLLALALLPFTKGGVVGLQWALRMHGFGGHGDEAEADFDAHPENDRTAQSDIRP